MIDKESLKKLLPEDLISSLSTPENGVGRFKDALSEQSAALLDIEESELYEGKTSLLESLEGLQEFDEDIYLAVVETATDWVKNNKLRPEDITKLILNFELTEVAEKELTKKYGSAKGVMTWNNFQIVIHDALKERDNQGELIYNVGHHLSHEIGHSLTEIDAISSEEIKEIFDGIGIEFESSHIKRLTSSDTSDELILMERFAECVGIYLRSNSLKDFVENRAENCSHKVEESFEDSEYQKAFLNESNQLYDRISKIWPDVQQRLAETDLNQHLSTALNIDENYAASFDQSQFMGTPPTGAETEGTPVAPIPSDQLNRTEKAGSSKSGQMGYQETSDLAKNQKHSESFYQTISNLFSNFANELNITNSIAK